MNILYVSSEAYPLVKTGGLGDVLHGLPQAVQELGHDVRLALPFYQSLKSYEFISNSLISCQVTTADRVFDVEILRADFEGLEYPVYLVDVPELFDRDGGPYNDSEGNDWPDNALRFYVFSRAVTSLSLQTHDAWKPDIVHANDWQTGLVPAFLSQEKIRPKTIFTIHNLAYSGQYSREIFDSLALPEEWWSVDGVEFYGGFSMLKAGIVFADKVTTVSPTYAAEICQEETGMGFDGVLRHYQSKLSGILNGIDDVWDPRNDEHIKLTYGPGFRRIKAKHENKLALLETFNIKNTSKPVIGFIGRLVDQKGIDLVLHALPVLIDQTDAVFIFLGKGNKQFEDELLSSMHRFRDRVSVIIGYSEDIAHKIEAGSDLFLMPSRFEPCGLNQLYSLKYGTPPIVHRTGGLADTVIDATKENLKNSAATGFVFDEMTTEALLEAIQRAITCFRKTRVWQKICRCAMEQKYCWQTSAREYITLYE